MEYLLLFLEGLITFVSPCLLPMLPVYISFFAGGAGGGRRQALVNALGFVLGFTIVFVLLGLFAGTLGRLLAAWQTVVNIISGAVVVLFGLHYTGVLQIGFLNRTLKLNAETKDLGFLSSVVFGFVFSIGWTPCVGVFLGSALMIAAQQASAVKGVALLLFYSAGLGLPFVLAAVLIDRLKTAFDWVKKHYRAVSLVSGVFLILIGLLMMLGLMNRFLAILAV